MKVSRLLLLTALSTLLVLNACSKKTGTTTARAAEMATPASAETAAPAHAGHREWYSFPEGMKLAEAGDKHIVIDFYTDWCKWCKTMDKETFSDPDVDAYLFEHFIPIRINAESDEKTTFMGKEYSYRQLTSAFGVTGFPSLAYLSPQKEVITVIPGFVKKDQFLDILSYISKDCYAKNISFDTFKENGDCQ